MVLPYSNFFFCFNSVKVGLPLKEASVFSSFLLFFVATIDKHLLFAKSFYLRKHSKLRYLNYHCILTNKDNMLHKNYYLRRKKFLKPEIFNCNIIIPIALHSLDQSNYCNNFFPMISVFQGN